MTPTPFGAAPHLVVSLARVAKRHPVARKLVVSPNISAGRELLRRLSLIRGGWIGFEVTTPRPLALRLARPAMDEAGLETLDAFEEQAMLDRALDAAVASERGVLAELSEGVGFRTKVHEAVRALRLADIGPAELDRAHFADWRKRRFVLRVLQRYERFLTERSRADTATILRLGVQALEDAGGVLPAALDAEVVLLMPGLGVRGLSGRLISGLAARGAKVLETDAVAGLEQPSAMLWNRRGAPSAGSCLYDPESLPPDEPGLEIDMFRAASINDELREVIRRISARGLRFDEVEIITPDPASYGSALHALSVRLGVPVTYAVGLPIERTRTGRVVQAYLDWIEEGFQAAPIRRLLEAGDLRPPNWRVGPSPAALARRFRSLRVGWGRSRYRSQIRAAFSGLEALERRSREGAESFERRRAHLAAELEALRLILYPALKATPAVPDRMGVGGAPVSPAELARGLQAFLKRVPKGRGPDRSAREEVARILERIDATLRRRTDFRAAVSTLRAHLALRVRAESVADDPDERGAPWSSEGGAIHIADLEHGGYSSRPAVFFVGMDADRVPGGAVQDPVLLDGDRRVLGDGLPTSTELMRERVFRFAALVARLRGGVTLSYTGWSPSEARTLGPSPALLQALRLARRDASLTFEDLSEALGRVVSAVPERPRPALDREDVWMSALSQGDSLRLGVDAVRSGFPNLDRGLTAKRLREDGTPSAVHGVIEPRPEELDPRLNQALAVSASRAQDLGTCPLRYLHKAVLGIYPPDDPELDPDSWLDALRKGALLHSVFEVTLRTWGEGVIPTEDASFEKLALETLARKIEIARRDVPVPGEGTLARETAALQEDVRSFVRMVRERGAPWVQLEWGFGFGEDDPVLLPVRGGAIRIRGAIDRIDRDLSGLHVIDYKTGLAWGFDGDTGAFNGGRRLQHALYAHAAEAHLQGSVVSGEYHHPTRRGENRAFVFDRLSLSPVNDLLAHLFDGVAEGYFVPTDQSDDCKFCDYAAICRVRVGEWGRVTSPLADWSEEHFNTGMSPALVHLKRVRTFED